MTMPYDACKPAGLTVADVLADILGTDLQQPWVSPASSRSRRHQKELSHQKERGCTGAVTRVNGTRDAASWSAGWPVTRGSAGRAGEI